MKRSLCAYLIQRLFRIVVMMGIGILIPSLALSAPSAQSAEIAKNISDQVEQFLVELVGQQFAGEPIVHVIAPTSVQSLAHCEIFHIYLPPGRSIRSSTTVAVRCQHTDSNPIYVRASVEIEGTHYVAAQNIAINQAITEAMLEPRTGDLLRLPAHALTPPGQLIGRLTTQRIQVGQPIRMSATRSMDAIQRGDRVRVETHAPGIYITTIGEALTSAEIGSTIEVRMPNAKVIRGIVGGSGVVFVTF